MRCLLLITLVLASTLPSQAAVYVCETKHGFDLSAGDLTRSQSILFPRIFGFNDATGELDYGPPESQSRCDLLGKERLTIATRDSGNGVSAHYRHNGVIFSALHIKTYEERMSFVWLKASSDLITGTCRIVIR
jgi:hypothetical protein